MPEMGNNDEIKDENLDVASENKDEEKNEDGISAEDDKDDTEVGDGEKQEDDEVKEDPHEKLLAQLKKDNRQKSMALKEKNQKIQELKEKLEDNGYDKDEIKILVDEVLGTKLQSVEETQKKLEEALKVANENNIDSVISKYTDNTGEKKIIRHFFDNEVNKNLPFNKQIEQAFVLAKHAMSDDNFQKEVKKANEMAIKTSGKIRSEADIPSHIREIADKLFQTKEGRKQFLDNYSRNN